jgi:VCBS repeat-containing protein
MSPGNHDETAGGVANFYDQYFPVSRFQGFPWYMGYLGKEADDPVNRQNKNNYEFFSVGSLDFLVIHIELDWPDYSVAWADKIIKRYPNRRVILSSHAFVNTSNARPTSAQFRSNGTSAEAVWQQIIKPNCNVFMVINGHYPGEGRRTDLNDCGQPVHQILMDYQSRANGGDGWLRYFTFKPSENKIYAYTYSPTRNGGLGEFETDDSSQFVLDYNMNGGPFSVIATNSNVASGARTTATWPGLTPNTDYEWYVTLNDSKVTTTGPVWGFRATAAQGNTAPVATSDAFVVGEDLTLNVPAPGVLSNDTDADGNSLGALIVTSPSHGALALNVNGGFAYVPAANYSGPDSFTYKANDGTVDSNVATVTITITAVNDAPLAADQAVATDEDTPKVIALSATDAEGSPLTYAIVARPAHGTLSGTPPALTYTPAANYSGPDSFTFKANDGGLDSNTATVTITVAAVNDAPVATDQTITTDEDSAKAITLSATDAEGSPLSYGIVTGPAHGTLTGTAPALTYTPAANYNGPDSFTFKANDGTVDSNVATVTITVTAVNDAPIATDQAIATDEDTPKAITLGATDVEGSALTYAIVSGPTHGALAGTAPALIYTPPANYNGTDSFTFKANDGSLDSNTATVTIAVAAVNDAPVAAGQAVTTDEDTAKAITLSATDAEGSLLTYAIVSGPAHGSLSGIAPALIYTPAVNYNGPDGFTFKANDGNLDSNAATVTITVTAVNDAPVATDQAITTDEDTAKPITLSATDIEGSPLTYAIVAGPAHGTLAGTAPALAYTPAANYNGPDGFTFKANDGSLDSTTATVTITVTAVNDAPVATDQAIATDEDTPKAITLSATDVEGSPLTYAIVAGPAHGTLSGTAPTVTYTPAANYDGPDSFTFKANDGSLDSNTATVTIIVAPVNDVPVAVDQTVATDEDTAKTITLNATDVEGSPLAYTILTSPVHGTLSGTAPALTYTPAANYNGADSFTFRVNDGSLDSNVATVTITVAAVDDAPVATDQAIATDEDAPKPVTLAATDIEGSPLTYTIVTSPVHGALTGTAPVLTYTPAANYNGPDSFTFKANDGSLD